MKKKILIVSILITFLFLISSCGMRKKINDLGNIYENNENVLVFTAGITKDNKTYWFKDLIAKEVKSLKKKLFNERFYTSGAYLLGDLYYFVFQYYSRYEKDGYINQKYVTGYIDLNDFKVELFKFYEDEEQINIYKFGDKIVFLENEEAIIYDKDGKIKTFDLNGYKLSTNIYSKQLILHKEDEDNNNYWVIESNLQDRKFTTNKENYLYYVDDDYLVYLKASSFIGINLKTDSEIVGEELEDILKKARNVYNVFIYNEKLYNYYIEDQFEDNDSKRGYLLIESDEFNKSISMAILRELVPEVIKIEELFNTEIYFKEVISVNNHIYISLVNDESFFGFYSGKSCPPIVLKYDIENNSFEYMGYFGATHYSLVKVIEAS